VLSCTRAEQYFYRCRHVNYPRCACHGLLIYTSVTLDISSRQREEVAESEQLVFPAVTDAASGPDLPWAANVSPCVHEDKMMPLLLAYASAMLYWFMCMICMHGNECLHPKQRLMMQHIQLAYLQLACQLSSCPVAVLSCSLVRSCSLRVL
jgi:hypothetical protein